MKLLTKVESQSMSKCGAHNLMAAGGYSPAHIHTDVEDKSRRNFHVQREMSAEDASAAQDGWHGIEMPRHA